MLKRRFARTNKRNYTRQLAAAEVRERFIRRVARRIAGRATQSRTQRASRAHADTDEIDTLPMESTTASTRYCMAENVKNPENILEWIHANRTDIATKVWHTNHRCTF